VINENDQLVFREAQVRWRRAGEILVDAKIGPDERVIISHLQSPVPGMQVRKEGAGDVRKKGNAHLGGSGTEQGKKAMNKE
jgi:hypothetical protein